MKRCPECRRTYDDETLNFCLDDGISLTTLADERPTMRFGYVDTRSVSPAKSIAVLPFSNVSADPENEYFCDGLAEELLSSLARIEDLKVASRTSAFSFKGKNAKLGEIAAALNVETVLEGSVRRSESRLRVSVQLVNAADDRPIWSERYDREMKDIFDVQDEITLSVVDALKVVLLGEERAALLKRYTNSPEAYQLFMKGRYHWYKHTPEDLRQSLGYFQKAVAVDPKYAPGRAGLAEFYGISAAIGLMDPSVGWPIAEAELKRAQDLDDGLPEVHNGLGAVWGICYRDFDEAERELRRAMELNPRFAEAHSLFAIILMAQGRVEDAIRECTAALELDPLSISYHRYLTFWFYCARRHDDALAVNRRAAKIQPEMPAVYEDLRDIMEQAGHMSDAVEAWKRASLLANDTEMMLALEGETDPSAGFVAAAKVSLERLTIKLALGEWVPPAELARWYVRLRDTENALAWLEKAVRLRDRFSLLLSVDPFYDPIRDDPRIEGIIQCSKTARG